MGVRNALETNDGRLEKRIKNNCQVCNEEVVILLFLYKKYHNHFRGEGKSLSTLIKQSIYGIISLETKDKMYDDFVHILSTLNKLLVIFIIQIILIIICTKCL